MIKNVNNYVSNNLLISFFLDFRLEDRKFNISFEEVDRLQEFFLLATTRIDLAPYGVSQNDIFIGQRNLNMNVTYRKPSQCNLVVCHIYLAAHCI